MQAGMCACAFAAWYATFAGCLAKSAEGRRQKAGFRKQRARRPPAAASTTLSPGLDWQHKTILS